MIKQAEIPQAYYSLIESLEGLKLVPYNDGAGKANTIGFGHFIKPDESFDSITEDVAKMLLASDSAIAWDCLKQNITRDDLTDNQVAALLSFTFNEGCSTFQDSSLLDVVNAGQDDQVRQHLCMYDKMHVDGQLTFVQGLLNRRNKEADLYEMA